MVIHVDSGGVATIKVGPHTVGPYRVVGGHHPHQQAARTNNPEYKPGNALSMKDDGSFNHKEITKAQTSLNAVARKSGRPYSEVEDGIIRESMKRGQIASKDIETIMEMSKNSLESMNSVSPTRVPGSRRGN